MENNRLANIDSPTTDDRLGFSVYAAGIARTIRDAALRNQLPLTIGIYGRWGSGKTSLMKMVETELDRSSQPIPQTQVKRDSAELLVPFLWRLQGLYSILILAALVLAPRLGSWWSLRLNTKPEIATIGWLFASFVAFGGLTRAFFATWWHGRVENDLDTLGLVRIASATPGSELHSRSAIVDHRVVLVIKYALRGGLRLGHVPARGRPVSTTGLAHSSRW